MGSPSTAAIPSRWRLPTLRPSVLLLLAVEAAEDTVATEAGVTTAVGTVEATAAATVLEDLAEALRCKKNMRAMAL